MRDYKIHKENLLKKFNKSGRHCIIGVYEWEKFKKSAQRHGVFNFISLEKESYALEKKKTIKYILTYNYRQIRRMLDPGDYHEPIRLYNISDEAKLPLLMHRLLIIRKQYRKCFTKSGTIGKYCGPRERALTSEESEILNCRQVLEKIVEKPEIYGHE